MRNRTLRQVTVGILMLGLAAGCKSYNYVVPAPIVQQHAEPLPFQCGFLMSRELRDQWYSDKTVRSRVDVPIGRVILEFARAQLQNAFKTPTTTPVSDVAPETTRDFYTIRYYERRSQDGLLIRVRSIDFDVEGTRVRCALSIDIADARGQAILSKVYEGEGVPGAGHGLLQRTIYGENALELSTAAALSQIFTAILNDIRALYEHSLQMQQAGSISEVDPAADQ